MEHNIVTFKDKKGKNDVKCEVSIPNERKDLIKMTICNKESYIKIKDFYGVCLLLVKSKLLEKIIPYRERKVKKYKRQIKLIAQKDIKKGEEIITTYEVNVPQIIDENTKKIH